MYWVDPDGRGLRDRPNTFRHHHGHQPRNRPADATIGYEPYRRDDGLQGKFRNSRARRSTVYRSDDCGADDGHLHSGDFAGPDPLKTRETLIGTHWGNFIITSDGRSVLKVT